MSFLRSSLTFLYSLGMFDVILPFLLVFVLTFAVLERTKVLGTFKVGNDEYSKKNLNALAAFSLAFIVIGSAKLVSFLVSFAATMMVILVVISLLIILNASFYHYSGANDEFKISETHKKIMFWLIFLSVIVTAFMVIDFKSLLNNPNIAAIRQSLGGVNLSLSQQALANIGYAVFTFGFVGFFMWLILREEPSKKSKKD